jgi:hypothetical protein
MAIRKRYLLIRRSFRGLQGYVGLLAAVLSVMSCVEASAHMASYPSMAPIDTYLSQTAVDEIGLARSAGPPSISNDAEILTLGVHGYSPAVKGRNGFACIVERAWSMAFDDPGFWNPRVRAPICFNAAATRSVLPEYLMRTKWALSGASRSKMVSLVKAAVASHEITAPEFGSMCYMMSKRGYLGDDVGGPWHPHLMFFLPRMAANQWGANLPGSPVMAGVKRFEPTTVFLVPIAKWSDGSADGRQQP